MKPYILQTINFSTERSSWVPPRHDTRRQFAIWVMQARLGMNHGWWVMGGRPDETVWFSTLRPYRCFPGGMKVLPGIEVFLTMNLFYAQKKGKHVQCTSTIKSYKIIWGKPSHTSLGCLGVHVLSNVALVFLVGMICILPCFHPWHQKLVWMRTFCEIWIKNVLLFCFFWMFTMFHQKAGFLCLVLAGYAWAMAVAWLVSTTAIAPVNDCWGQKTV